MSHHSDDALLVAGSDSFWEPGNYKRTTKRTEDGFRLCNDLIQLIQERADVEKSYSKGLRSWARKWADLIEKGPEYGTTEAAWKGVLLESDRRSEMHTRVKNRLLNDVIAQVKSWQKENFHKSMMQLKERREMDEAFKKAQKPWAKLLARVDRAKADYHSACKAERSAINQERNAGADSSLSPDQVKKLQDRVARCKEEVQKTKERYETALHDINDYNAKYMEDMTVVFDKCQEFEQRRLAFFKEMLFGIHACLNITTDPELPQIYEEYRHTIQNADASKDLKWWSNNHGVGMAMNWPQFEEYTPEVQNISRKEKKSAVDGSGAITLTNISTRQEPAPQITTTTTKSTKAKEAAPSNNTNRNSVNTGTKSSNPFEEDEDEEDDVDSVPTQPSTTDMNGRGEPNPFEEEHEDWDEESNDALVDNGEPGVPVKALYDYEGAEADELSFKQGDVFEKLEDEDEQGWCKGRKDGRVGLYPANYVEVIASAPARIK